MAKNYLDKAYLTGTYGLDLNSLPKAYSDTEIARYIYLAEVRITHISDDFSDDTYNALTPLDQDEVKFLTSVIVEQWLKHGIPLSRVSTSATLSAVSSSATRPQDPAYVPHIVLEGLATLGLMKNFDSAKQIRAVKNGIYDGMGDNELNSRINNMIENAISMRFDGKENKVSPTGVQNGDSKNYIATWVNGVRQLKDIQDLFVSAGLSITPNRTIFGKKAKTIDISTFLKTADLTAATTNLEAADKLIEQEITSLKTTLEAEVRSLKSTTTSLSGKTSGGFIGNLTAATATSLSTPPASDKDYFYYHITSDPETVLGTVITGQNGKWVKIEAKPDKSGWNLITTAYLDASPFGLDAAGVDAKIADAEARIGTIIDTKIKPVVDWFETQGNQIFTDLQDLANEAKALEEKDKDIDADILAATVRIKKNEDFKKMFDDLTDGTFIFKKDDTTYESKTVDQLATILATETEFTDKDKKLATTKEIDDFGKTIKVKDSTGTKVDLPTMTGQVSATDTTEDLDKTLVTAKTLDNKEKALQDALKLKANASTDWLVTTIETTSPGFFIFDETPAIDALPYESEVKVEWPATIPGTWGDTDQVQSKLPSATTTERVILNVAGTNVMNYSELKNDFDKYMIITKKKGTGTPGAVDENDYWQFVKFEIKPSSFEPTTAQLQVLNGKAFTTAHETRLNQIEASGLFLGDVISDKDETEADLITRVDGIFSTAIKGDHAEIIKETDTAGEAIYFLLTKGDTTWTKGAERTEHIKTGASGGATTVGIQAGVNSYTGHLVTFDKFESLAEITTTIKQEAFRAANKLLTITFPLATTVADGVFFECSELLSVDLPMATTFNGKIFADCDKLTTLNLPSATTIADGVLEGLPNVPTLTITLPSKFNTDAEKMRIFGGAYGTDYNHITFTWV